MSKKASQITILGRFFQKMENFLAKQLGKKSKNTNIILTQNCMLILIQTVFNTIQYILSNKTRGDLGEKYYN